MSSRNILFLFLFGLTGSCLAQTQIQGWECLVSGSDDRFLLYPEQRILRSDQFEVFALMGGLTLATVARDSGRFHRVSQLNLLPKPDRIQRFEGVCKPYEPGK